MKIVSNRHKNAIGCGSMYGPIFGDSPCDIIIYSDANTNTKSNPAIAAPHHEIKFMLLNSEI